MTNSTRSINKLLKALPYLTELAEITNNCSIISKSVNKVTRASLKPYYEVVDYSQHEVIIHAHSSTVATALRYNANTILEQIRKDTLLKQARSLNIRVKAQPLGTKKETKLSKHRPSKQTAENLKESAKAMGCPELEHAMRRLAGRCQD